MLTWHCWYWDHIFISAPSVNQVFTLDFESNPLYVDADFSLKTNIQPVEVVYDEVRLCQFI